METGEEIKRRKPVWEALSEFYLDTELTDEDHERIAKVFVNSGYDLVTLKEIDTFEVFPLLQYNLLSVAGEWGGFEESWLFDGCSRNYRKRNSWFHRTKAKLYNKRFYWMREEHWKKIEMLINNL